VNIPVKPEVSIYDSPEVFSRQEYILDYSGCRLRFEAHKGNGK
jgi:hypothetical protein